MTGVERRRVADADTFLEFDAWVSTFMLALGGLPDNSVLFGDGIWFALLWCKLLGFQVADSHGMRAFTDFRSQLAMLNCAVYVLDTTSRSQ